MVLDDKPISDEEWVLDVRARLGWFFRKRSDLGLWPVDLMDYSLGDGIHGFSVMMFHPSLALVVIARTNMEIHLEAGRKKTLMDTEFYIIVQTEECLKLPFGIAADVVARNDGVSVVKLSNSYDESHLFVNEQFDKQIEMAKLFIALNRILPKFTSYIELEMAIPKGSKVYAWLVEKWGVERTGDYYKAAAGLKVPHLLVDWQLRRYREQMALVP